MPTAREEDRTNAPPRVLYVEDDLDIGRLISTHMANSGFRCDWVRDGASAVAHFQAGRYSLILLDLMLPQLSGLDVCRQVRLHDPRTPLIMISARADIRDVVLGLELGADDYITKPFSVRVLHARIQALLRRQAQRTEAGEESPQPIVRGPLVIDPLQHRVTLGGRLIDLTAKEFNLLTVFATHPGRSFSRGELLDRVWGADFEGFDHTVNTHINRLRGKIEVDPAQPRLIRTVWGVGYRFEETAADTPDAPP